MHLQLEACAASGFKKEGKKFNFPLSKNSGLCEDNVFPQRLYMLNQDRPDCQTAEQTLPVLLQYRFRWRQLNLVLHQKAPENASSVRWNKWMPSLVEFNKELVINGAACRRPNECTNPAAKDYSINLYPAKLFVLLVNIPFKNNLEGS